MRGISVSVRAQKDASIRFSTTAGSELNRGRNFHCHSLQRERRHRYPEMFSLSDLTPYVLQRFWSKIVVEGDCWLWMAGCNSQGGYPVMRVRLGAKSQDFAIRIAYAIHYRAIPTLTLKQTCGNKLCLRPEHIVPSRPYSINDQFTSLPVSRERKRQLRKIHQGLCSKARCMERLAGNCYCISHMIEQTERQRERKRAGKRNNCVTRRMQEFRSFDLPLTGGTAMAFGKF